MGEKIIATLISEDRICQKMLDSVSKFERCQCTDDKFSKSAPVLQLITIKFEIWKQLCVMLETAYPMKEAYPMKAAYRMKILDSLLNSLFLSHLSFIEVTYHRLEVIGSVILYKTILY